MNKRWLFGVILVGILVVVSVVCFLKLRSLFYASLVDFDVGMVTFTMDDGHKGQYLHAFPIFLSRDIPVTVYIISDRVENPSYVTVDELREMVAAGWEVGGHGGSPLTEMSDEELEAEVKASREVLENHGFSLTSFAYPWGRFDDRVVSTVRTYYETAVHVSATGLPYTASELGSDGDKPWTQFGRRHIMDTDITLQHIDQTIAEKAWMIFFFHDAYEDGTVDYGANLIQIADYVKSKVDAGILKTVTFSQGWNTLKREDHVHSLLWSWGFCINGIWGSVEFSTKPRKMGDDCFVIEAILSCRTRRCL